MMQCYGQDLFYIYRSPTMMQFYGQYLFYIYRSLTNQTWESLNSFFPLK